MAEPSAATVTAAIVVIGNEILSGRTRDANMHFLAGRLSDLAIRLKEVRVVSDDTAAIVAAVNEVRARYDYVFTSGGIGPTHDDITADAIAAAFGVGIDVDPRARDVMERYYPPGQLNAARLRMARIPFGASLIDNPVSAAPGFRIGNVFVMAGVPAIFQAMVESVRHELVGGAKLLARALASALPEGQIAEPLRAIQEQYPDIEIGSHPTYRAGVPTTTIVLRGTDLATLRAATLAVAAMMRAQGVEPEETIAT